MTARRTVVVTDSTACLPPEVAASRGIEVVPLQVVIDSEVYDEGAPGATPSEVAAALRDKRSVSTSRPGPESMRALYARLAAEGAEAVVAVHLSRELSGTWESAHLAAQESPVPVTCVDTRHAGGATGFAALAAADAIDAGGDAEAAERAARHKAAVSSSLFYVDTLEYLRRGGRIGGAAAFFGSALAVKPLLAIKAGKVASLEKVRTSARALARLEDLLVAAAGNNPVDLSISHLANPERASELAARLSERLADNLEGREVWCMEIGGVLGAHVGPGMVAGVLAPRD